MQKKSLTRIIALTFTFSTFVAAPAFAVVHCVKLAGLSGCSATFANNMSPDWAASCSDDVKIEGVSACSEMGRNIGETSNSITYAGDLFSNAQCWCKLTKPATSAWVFVRGFDDAMTCYESCNSACSDRNYLQEMAGGMEGSVSNEVTLK